MKADLSELPDDVAQLIAPHVAEDAATLDAISISIAQRRDEAKAARSSSGIETTWKESEDSYIGIDDVNRGEFSDARWAKPMSMDGPVTTGRTRTKATHKSTAFVRLTARYVDAGAAKLGEILLPVDDKAFSFSEMPLPELIKAKEDLSQVVHDGMGNIPLTRALKPGETPPPAPAPATPPMAASPQPTSPVPPAAAVTGAAGGTVAAAPVGGVVPAAGAVGPTPPPQVPLTVKDLAEERIEIERKKAKEAEKRIYNWMIGCQHPAEMRKVIFDSARIGVGVLKGPFPKSEKGIAVTHGDGGVVIEIKEDIRPATKWVDPWNIFPDPACGENIHNGDYIFERDTLSERQVRDLKEIPGYIGTQIDKVLVEGAERAEAETNKSDSEKDANKNKGRYEIWYYYGSLKSEEMNSLDLAAFGKGKTNEQLAAGKKQVYAIVTLINQTVVRATINPLDSGKFPYHSVPWQRRSGHWAGIGVSEQIKTPQKTLNAAFRAMLNNAGKAAGAQYVIDQSAIKPADGSWTIVPDKIWYKTGDSPGSDVRQAFMAIDAVNCTEPLLKILDLADKLAEDATSIPLITQGQSGATTPDTFGAAQLQNNNANQLLRTIGYAFDDYITEPVVRQFYEWLLLDPDVPDEEKGEFKINAHGSVALVERAIQDQTIAQMGTMATNPIYGIDPKKWTKMFLKSKRLNPEDLQYTEEQQAKIDAAPPPQAPAVQAASIAADAALKQAVMKQQGDAQSIASEEKIEQAAQTLEGQKVQVKATVDLHELQMRHQLAMLDHANKMGMSINDVKSELARTAMTLNTQKQLNASDNATDLAKHRHSSQQPPKTLPNAKPLAKAPGRSGNNRGFAQT